MANIGEDFEDENFKKQTIEIPESFVGLLIGKGGDTIRQMQEVTGAKMHVS